MSSFKQAFESKLNNELQEDHKYPPPPIDVEVQQDHQPVHVFTSYPPEPARRSGIYVPTFIFVGFVLLFLLESGIIFVYTIVALWNTLPGSMGSMTLQPLPCNCPPVPAVVVAPNGWPQLDSSPTTITQTRTTEREVTVTVTPSVSPTKSSSTESTKSSTSESSSSSSSSESSSSSGDPTATESALAGLLSAFEQTSTSHGVVTVTAPVPTSTVLSTASVKLPSITTMTVMSTAMAAAQSTVTSVAFITAGQ